MLTIDDRIGSAEFKPLLARLGAPVRIKRLPFADFAFRGHGPNGSRVRIAVERKTISEICGAVTDSRFTGHQIPGLLQTFDYVWVVIEGYAVPDPKSGILMQGKWSAGYGAHRHLYQSIKKFELTLQVKGCIRIEHTKSKIETAYFLRALYDWWQAPYTSHKSVYQVEELKPDAALLDARTLKRRVAAQLPGVGWVHSRKVDRYFPTIEAMVSATGEEWNAALGIKAGTKTAAALVRACRKVEAKS